MFVHRMIVIIADGRLIVCEMLFNDNRPLNSRHFENRHRAIVIRLNVVGIAD